ncbi:MAG: TolC family protein [Cytophagales bacterium]|nr:TolC family protein [Cytophagales bacterium]
MKTRTLILLLVSSLLTSLGSEAQNAVTLDEAIRLALKNNQGLRSTALEIDFEQQRKRMSGEIPKTEALLMVGQINSAYRYDNNVQVTQKIPFPTVFTTQAKLGGLRVQSSQFKQASSENELVYRVNQVYITLRYLQSQQRLFHRQDSLYDVLVKSTTLRYKTGEATLLQKMSVEMRQHELQNVLRQNRADQAINRTQLQILMNHPEEITIVDQPLEPVTTTLVDDSTQTANNPQLAYRRLLSSVALQEKRVDVSKALPDLTVGYFNQTLTGHQQLSDGSNQFFPEGHRFTGFMVGLAIPIWYRPTHAQIRSSSIRAAAQRLSLEYYEKQLYGEWHQAVQQFNKQKNSLTYYTQSALPNARLILRQALLAFNAGDIGQTEYRLEIHQALAIEDGYLQTLLQYNQSIITLEYLSGKYTNN